MTYDESLSELEQLLKKDSKISNHYWLNLHEDLVKKLKHIMSLNDCDVTKAATIFFYGEDC